MAENLFIGPGFPKTRQNDIRGICSPGWGQRDMGEQKRAEEGANHIMVNPITGKILTAEVTV
eukprot:68927-Pyramimonas_sp.AAC.1